MNYQARVQDLSQFVEIYRVADLKRILTSPDNDPNRTTKEKLKVPDQTVKQVEYFTFAAPTPGINQSDDPPESLRNLRAAAVQGPLI